MGFLDLFRSAAPPLAQTPLVVRAINTKKRSINAGEVTRLNANWRPAVLSADEEIKKNLEVVRGRSRDLSYNNEFARKYLQMVATHIVGPQGFTLQSLVISDQQPYGPDRLARDSIEASWSSWVLSQHFVDMQRMVIETVARDGEALLLRRRGAKNAHGYALKMIEIDRLPIQKNETLRNGNRIVMGIELDADDKILAYWLNLSPTIGAYNAAGVTLTRVPADEVLHIYRPGRAEQRRGLPWMHAVMDGMKMLAGYDEAAIVAARVGAAKMGFYTAPDGTVDPIADDQVEGEFYQDAEAGAFSVLPPGYDFKSWNPDYPHQGYEAFVKQRLRSIASGLGIAYHTLANDLADVNFSSARAGTLEERDNWIVLQNWMIDVFLRPVFLDWLNEALINGAIVLPSGKSLPFEKIDRFSVHQWQGRRWTWVDPLKDIEAARLAIKTGIASPQMIAAQNGVDTDDVLQAIATFEANIKDAKVTLVDLGNTPQNNPPA